MRAPIMPLADLGDDVFTTDVEVTVDRLARQLAGSSTGQDAGRLVAHVAARLAEVLGVRDHVEVGAATSARLQREELPAPAVGSWTLSEQMLNIVLGEN
jgi:hypothetical protein